ncbi:MAG: XTP/dITP diphosphatase [Firmicutes bacterium]|nr:XTP/dITP diphosphatase [Bacillota bacterium]
MKRQVVLATRNPGKVRELQRLLEGADVQMLSLAEFPGAPEVEETGRTFAENALLKAGSAAAHTGLIALADDSGLEVDALGGRPGVYSARFAGPAAGDEENNRKLLAMMQGVEGPARTARFRSAVAIASPDGRSRVLEGTCEGVLLDAPRGFDGFGYDPLFLVPDLGQTFAELPMEEKNRISHRGLALRKALRELPAFWEEAPRRE